MKKFLILFLMFSLVSLSFAAWQETVALAIFASLGLLAIIYMIAFGFGIEEMKMMARDELMQLVITAVLAIAIVGAAASTDTFTSSIVEAQGVSGKNMQEYVLDDILSGRILKDLEENYNNVNGFAEKMMYESSKTEFCTFMSTGLFISACNSYSLVSPPLSVAMQAMAVSFVEMQSLYMLIDIGYKFAFTFFLPIGLFLRSLKITRGAGAFFIALGITFYFILPLVVIFMDDLDEYYQIEAEKSPSDDIIYPAAGPLTIKKCNSASTGTGWGGDISMENPNKVITAFNSSLFPNLDAYIYQVFVRVNITLFVAVFAMATSIRWLTSVLGAEVDVSAIARLM